MVDDSIDHREIGGEGDDAHLPLAFGADKRRKGLKRKILRLKGGDG